MEGCIKLHRSIADKAYYKKDSERVHLWIHLLISAAHIGREEMFGGKPVFCEPGQFTTGRKKLSEETGINESKIERILTYFEKTEQLIRQQKSNLNRLITIHNWCFIEFADQSDIQQSNNNQTASKQPESEDKPKKNTARRKKTNIPEKESKLNSDARKIFESRYTRETHVKYSWLIEDTACMSDILYALKCKRIEKGLISDDDTALLADLSMFMNIAVKDVFIKNNLCVSVLFSQFDKIAIRAKEEEEKHRMSIQESLKNNKDE